MENGTFVAIDNQISGFFTFNNPYRNGFFDIVRNINKRLKSYLLSGDNDQEKPVLVPAFGDENHLKFRQTPLDKLNFIQHLQTSGEKVLYIGDGLNDAGALQQSDVGLVVSAGNNNFIPACDAILDADRFESLLQFKQLAVTGVRIVRWSYLIAFFYNIVGLSFALSGQLSPLIAAILMPLSSVSIVLFGVIAGNIAARRLKIDHIIET
jgi:Cu+-exporting ATPase